MAVLNFTLSEDAVATLRDALICLNKFSDDVSIEAQKDKLILTALNTSKSAYACFSFVANRFCSRYHFEGSAQNRDKFYCSLYIRALISIFRTRVGGDPQRDLEKGTAIDRCDVAIEDGAEGTPSRFSAKLVFRNGMSSTHRLSFEVQVPVHAKFSRDEVVNHWTIPSRTLRQLMEHFGPGVELLDVSSDGEHVKFTCFTEKTTHGDEVLKKPLNTSIAIEIDEFEDIELEDKLHIVMNVRDFRAIVQHAAILSNNLIARYSTPARPIQIAYSGDAVACEFLLMTVGERSGNPSQKTRKANKGPNNAQQQQQNNLVPVSRRTSAAPSEAPHQQEQQQPQAPQESEDPTLAQPRPGAMAAPPPPSMTSARNVIRPSAFDLRPSQRQRQRPPPPPSMRSESLFVDDAEDQWAPVNDEDEYDEENARLEWDHNAQRHDSELRMSRPAEEGNSEVNPTPASSMGLEPTQRLSDVERFSLFYRGPDRR